MKQYGFRHRILLLAVALVVATQLVMLFPVLDLIKRDSAEQAERTVGLAGVLFDEYMHNREEELLTTVNLLVVGLSVQASRREHARRSDDSLGAAQPREPRRRERRRTARSRRQRSNVSSTADEQPRAGASRACRSPRSRKARAIASSTSAASRIRPSRCRCARPTCARGSCSAFRSTTRWRRI